MTIGLLAQESNLDAEFRSTPSLRAAVRGGARHLEEMERRLHELEASGPAGVESPEYAALRDNFDAHGGYSLDVRVDAALSGLGFSHDDWPRSPLEMSGGEQTGPRWRDCSSPIPDLLMLDEPTNHLDVSAIEWLETALVERHGALIVAAHDRAFLDNVVQRVWELRDRRLRIVPRQLLGLRASARGARRAPAQGRGDTAGGCRARAGAGPALPQPSQVQQDARARAPARSSRNRADRRPQGAPTPGAAAVGARRWPGSQVGRGRPIAGRAERRLFWPAVAGSAAGWMSAAGSKSASSGRTVQARPRCCARLPASWRRSPAT